MSATAALILLMDSATACGALAPTPPRNGADAVRAILEVETEAFEPSGPTSAGAIRPPVETPTDAMPEADQPDADAPAVRCDMMPTVIA
jgi:hypothetical protein